MVTSTPVAAMPSTLVRSIRYDAQRSELEIVFQSGRIYVYEGVPETVAAAMRASFSKGEFFNREIRDRYSFRREAHLADAVVAPHDTTSEHRR